ncbi:MAG: 4-hydroxy-tetrahydrodipicolinate synthase [Algoriphagus sp.]|uniref:4-hydroxy-tetrahydrodipicolinate synthase n=1 Tax=Algoriphagus sp. TaxID=1872435 RepID=UPI00273138B4|nr:4-hydroxy-tetrahydrodipicolinate synthase [Algoriphagus sp.]MDP2042581.1 4-hydroxy-tetrahydrodipicolinate synthase [Algoriphagus sp.]MDP3472737.1 4-hydroxy-tetrahydrodipicolinate synthase [Algoriphagus sp.]
MNAFKGTGVALVTPFHDDQSIDFASLKKLIDHVISGGVDYLVVLGTTGEATTLTSSEKKQVLKACLEYNAGRVPVMLGIGGNNTHAVVNEIKNTDFYGVAAILSVSPYYNKPSQEGIIAHYSAIAEASPVPVVLYNIPGRTMSNMTAATTLKLSHHPNIVAMKEASGNLEQCMQIASVMPKDFLLLSGDDILTKALMGIGGSGVISVMANAFPEKFRILTHGKEEDSLAVTFSLLEMNSLMYVEGNPVGVKNLLFHMGIIESDQVRLPMLRASLDLNNKIKAAFQN